MVTINSYKRYDREMISSFLTKLLTARQANLTEEEIQIFDMKYSMQPIESLIFLQEKIGKPELMKDFGRSYSNTIVEHFKAKFSIEEDRITSIWTNIFNISGFGKLKIVNMDKNGGIVEIKNNNFANVYKVKHGKQNKPVCHMIAGVIEGIFEKTTGKDVKCLESSCIATGKSACVFEVK